MEEAIKSLQIGPKVLAKRSYAMWDIRLVTEVEANWLVGNILTTKAVRLQTGVYGHP